jgi:hypothetical protein
MHGAAYEAVFIYCECAATKQIGLPGGEKMPTIRYSTNYINDFDENRATGKEKSI